MSIVDIVEAGKMSYWESMQYFMIDKEYLGLFVVFGVACILLLLFNVFTIRYKRKNGEDDHLNTVDVTGFSLQVYLLW